MLGIILWYNTEKGVGLVWCEDQGPLAFVGPDVAPPANANSIQRGQQIWFEYEQKGEIRTVSRIASISGVIGNFDPAQVLASFDAPPERPAFRVVA